MNNANRGHGVEDVPFSQKLNFGLKPKKLNLIGRTKMTRKDYVMLAKIIKENIREVRTTGDAELVIDMEGLVEDLCYKLVLDNPNFDEDKFRRACNGK